MNLYIKRKNNAINKFSHICYDIKFENLNHSLVAFKSFYLKHKIIQKFIIYQSHICHTGIDIEYQCQIYIQLYNTMKIILYESEFIIYLLLIK